MSRKNENKVVEGVQAIRWVPPERGTRGLLHFNNGLVGTSGRPYSLSSAFLYDVEYQPMDHSNPVILSATPKKLPLTLRRLVSLFEVYGEDFDATEIACASPGHFDPSNDAPDQTENLKNNFPVIYEQLSATISGVLYLDFEYARFLPVLYPTLFEGMELYEIRQLVHILRTTPALLAFRATLPSFRIPEIGIEEFDMILSKTETRYNPAETSAIDLYNKWIKHDVKQYGHTSSLVAHATKYVPMFTKQGLDFLRHNKIVCVEEEKYATSSVVLDSELAIKESVNLLKSRYSDDIPTREEKDAYEHSDELVPLSDDQRDALGVLLGSSIAILSGAAGTGKTTILSHLVNRFSTGTILACGPTNRAARILADRVIEASTMHRLCLDIMGDSKKYEKVRIVLVDESSMVSLKLFAYFLRALVCALPNIQRVYLVGDTFQLEPVEAGCILKEFSKIIPVANLLKCHRVDMNSVVIYQNAMKIREKNPDIKTVPGVFEFSPATITQYDDIENALEDKMNMGNTHFISPYAREASNISSLVKRFYTGKQHYSGNFEVGDKIMSKINNIPGGYCNGEFFIIKTIFVMNLACKEDKTFEKVIKRKVNDTNTNLAAKEFYRFMVVPASFEEREREKCENAEPLLIDFDLVGKNSFVLGYCTTGHQFQGGQADHIVLDLRRESIEPAMRFGFVDASHIYTAITRARKSVKIIGSVEAFKKCVAVARIPKRNLMLRHLTMNIEDMANPNYTKRDLPEEIMAYFRGEIEERSEKQDNGGENLGKRSYQGKAPYIQYKKSKQ